jgi:hypothetical protein
MEKILMEKLYVPIIFIVTFLYCGLAAITIAFIQRKKTVNLGFYVDVDNISGAPLGIPCVIRGTAIAYNRPISSRVTKSKVVYVKSYSQRNVAPSSNDPLWRNEMEPEIQSCDFIVRDASGDMYVESNHAHYFLPDNPAYVYADNAGPKYIRYQEYSIAEGDVLDIYGVVTLQGNDRIIHATSRYPLLISAIPREQVHLKIRSYFKIGINIGILFLIASFLIAFFTFL